MVKEKITKYLGIDWGEKRIGLAIADSESKTAVPYAVVNNLGEVSEVVEKEEINEVVIGRPIKMSGESEYLTPEFNEFNNFLKNNLKVPVHEIDERLSSKAADALPGDKKTKAGRDTVAAMLILQSYLDRKRHGDI